LSYIFTVLPVFLDDLNKRMLGWGKEGKMNPFKEVYDVGTLHDL
jgi:sterol 14-demethylase